ncbi:MAG: PKD domain-containing protein [Bacteroidetes bacterium]|nr:PKD domain-containing protein [Bacteroidota bacterium]
MKNRLLIFFLLFTTFITGNAFGVTVYISGTITDIQGSSVVPNHKVYIKTDFSSPFHYYKTVYTDNQGLYADTVQNVPAYPVSFQISTYDCDNEVHLISDLSTHSPITGNFQICVPPYSGCRADFSCDSIAGLNYQFTDQSETNSTLVSWNWNFGDPASGTNNQSSLQNPNHLYSGAGIYNVKLVIHAVNGCKDSLVKTVFIRIPENEVVIHGRITDDQTGEPISSQPVMINTTLIQYSRVVYSTLAGNYSDTIPAVPNGIPISVATYDCNNILHSNTVYSSPDPQEVNFQICLSASCQAAFTAVLDSNNKTQNTFLFGDLSYGDPNRWHWNFGDGTSSPEQNPVHHFPHPGNYRVSLTITKEDSAGGWNCYDTTSMNISASAYFNLGGLLFAGLYPINNPNPTGDTGVAFLYRSHNKWIAPVDTVYFTYLGYYAFLNILEGSYIVKAGLTKGSVHYPDYLPAYSSDQITWQTATSFLLDQNIFDKAIHLFPATDSITGPAMLKGSVVYHGSRWYLPHAEVLLYDDKLIPVKSAFTDDQGLFEFATLPYGTYNLYPEVTGKYAKVLQVTVDADHPVIENNVLEVFDYDVTGISPGEVKNDLTIGKIFPNPVTEDFQFQVFSPRAVTISAEILTLTGERILMKPVGSVTGRSLMTLPMGNVPSGMYFLVIRTSEGRIVNTQKILKN